MFFMCMKILPQGARKKTGQIKYRYLPVDVLSKTSASSLLSVPSNFSVCISRDNIKLGFGAKMADVTTALCAGKKLFQDN